ncbi:MAG: peptide chain release factor N(5)-glutamine methyltransferase [Acidobacteriota bacterium]
MSDSHATVDHLLGPARRRLAQAAHRPAAREAALLLAHVLGWSEAQVIARGETVVDPAAVGRFTSLVERRSVGEPVAYLLGEREFFGRRFAVDRRVLIPRPETEHLIETVLDLPLRPAPRLLDIGTGSGCIATTLALERGDSWVVGTDISLAALALARHNAVVLGASTVRWLAGDLAEALPLASFDLVASNPPYIGVEEESFLSREVVDFEPHGALFSPGGSDTILRRLIVGAASLRSGGFMVLEVGFDQAGPLLDSMASRLLSSHLAVRELRRDLAGIPRVLVLAKE